MRFRTYHRTGEKGGGNEVQKENGHDVTSIEFWVSFINIFMKKYLKNIFENLMFNGNLTP